MLYLSYQQIIKEGVTTNCIHKTLNGVSEKGARGYKTNMAQYNIEQRIEKVKQEAAALNIKWVDKEFVNAKTNITYECLTCSTLFDTQPQIIHNAKAPCPECRKVYKQKKFLDKAEKTFKDNFHKWHLDENWEIVTIPKLVQEPADFKHKACGNVIHTSLQNLSRTTKKKYLGNGTGCSYCSGTHTYTDEEIKKYIKEERVNYTFVRSFVEKMHLMVVVKHEVCGNEKTLQFNYFTRGEGCRHCKVSGGEETIMYALDNLGVDYEHEKSFDDLVSKKGSKLRYDFFLPDNNVIIEYDGRQHYEHVDTWIPEKDYNRYIENDGIKDNYALDNNITLLRIPFSIKGSELIGVVNSITSGNEDVYKLYKVK